MIFSDTYYMDAMLHNNLPPELVEIIMKDVHRRYMKDLCVEIINNVVWIKIPCPWRTKEKSYSFYIGKTSNNPFYLLRVF